jgi:hypothetical protein
MKNKWPSLTAEKHTRSVYMELEIMRGFGGEIFRMYLLAPFVIPRAQLIFTLALRVCI